MPKYSKPDGDGWQVVLGKGDMPYRNHFVGLSFNSVSFAKRRIREQLEEIRLEAESDSKMFETWGKNQTRDGKKKVPDELVIKTPVYGVSFFN